MSKGRVGFLLTIDNRLWDLDVLIDGLARLVAAGAGGTTEVQYHLAESLVYGGFAKRLRSTQYVATETTEALLQAAKTVNSVTI